MDIRNKYWIISLSLMLSVSLIFPFCCHAASAEKGAPHQQEVSAQTVHAHQHSALDCSCGHETLKNLQKPNNVLSSANSLTSQVVTVAGILAHPMPDYTAPTRRIKSFLPDNSGPPLHILHSVFLN